MKITITVHQLRGTDLDVSKDGLVIEPNEVSLEALKRLVLERLQERLAQRRQGNGFTAIRQGGQT